MKYKNYGFWTSLSASVVVMVTAVGKHFGFEISSEIVTDIVMGVAGVLVIFGIVKMPKPNKETDIEKKSETDSVLTKTSQNTNKTEIIETQSEKGELTDETKQQFESLDNKEKF